MTLLRVVPLLMWLAAVPFDCNVAKPSKPTVDVSDGLQYRDVVLGSGARADSGATLTVDYVAWLDNGTKVDASADHGGSFTFTLGTGQVIAGWDMAVPGMRAGGTRLLIVPPDLAYGPQGVANVIPPNAKLVFNVKLLGVTGAAVASTSGGTRGPIR